SDLASRVLTRLLGRSLLTLQRGRAGRLGAKCLRGLLQVAVGVLHKAVDELLVLVHRLPERLALVPGLRILRIGIGAGGCVVTHLPTLAVRGAGAPARLLSGRNVVAVRPLGGVRDTTQQRELRPESHCSSFSRSNVGVTDGSGFVAAAEAAEVALRAV